MLHMKRSRPCDLDRKLLQLDSNQQPFELVRLIHASPHESTELARTLSTCVPESTPIHAFTATKRPVDHDRVAWESLLLWTARLIIIGLIIGGAVLTMVTLNPLWTAAGTLAGWWVLAAVGRAHGGRWALPSRGLAADVGAGFLLAAGGVLLALPGAAIGQALDAANDNVVVVWTWAVVYFGGCSIAIIRWGLRASRRWTR
jgi:hypothetical protein